MATFDLVLLRLTLAPIFIGIVSWISRVSGPRVAGVLMGLPINTGIVLYLLALGPGSGFASTAAASSLLAVVAISTFSLAFAGLLAKLAWWQALAVASASYLVEAGVLSQVDVPVWMGFLSACTMALLVWKSLPHSRDRGLPTKNSRFEVPIRMGTALALVFSITTAATAVGPRWSGLLSAFPVYTTTILAFECATFGPPNGLSVVRGLQLGMLSYSSFLLIVGLFLVPLGILWTFLVALAVVATIQILLVSIERRSRADGIDRSELVECAS